MSSSSTVSAAVAFALIFNRKKSIMKGGWPGACRLAGLGGSAESATHHQLIYTLQVLLHVIDRHGLSIVSSWFYPNNCSGFSQEFLPRRKDGSCSGCVGYPSHLTPARTSYADSSPPSSSPSTPTRAPENRHFIRLRSLLAPV